MIAQSSNHAQSPNRLSIAVPPEHADEVRRYAAYLQWLDRNNAHRPASSEGSTSDDGYPDYPLWADDEVLELANSDTKMSRIYQQIMNAVLEREMVAEWVTIDQISEWTGIERSRVSTFRTHLYRHIHAHFGKDRAAPFTGADGNDLTPRRGRIVLYRVSTECAEQWQRIRARLR